ncbi:hypothetical protein Q3O60_17395 [Alkalimonas collagenimarina]|uniref:Uncharacterized protein n=1 Tax=Alkalimonas collagenimarina TaxID=400390 RepID=A0ABT9H3T5_9GAMM|nr:hypothetical protein [Alkalimonas collagenimarina]MDP4537958.1 hypothetical protein [Alkalimonas collagenimarina]
MAGGFNGIGQSPESWSRHAGEPSIEPCPPVGRQGADQSRNDVPLLPEAPPLSNVDRCSTGHGRPS